METPITSQQPLPMPPEQSGSSRRMKMILGAIAILAIIIVAVLFGGKIFKGSFLTGDTNYAISLVSADKDADGKTVLVYTFTNKTGADITQDSLLEVKGFTDANTDTPFFTRPLNYKSTFRADESVTMKTTFAPAVIGEYKGVILKVYRAGEEKSATALREPGVVATGGGSAARSAEPAVDPAPVRAAIAPGEPNPSAPTLSEEEAAAAAAAAAAATPAPVDATPAREAGPVRTEAEVPLAPETQVQQAPAPAAEETPTPDNTPPPTR